MPPKKPAKGRSPKRDFYTYHDQQLMAAKNNGALVTFALAAETYFTDEECRYNCTIEAVDKYDIKTSPVPGSGRRVIWIKKAMIVGIEIGEAIVDD